MDLAVNDVQEADDERRDDKGDEDRRCRILSPEGIIVDLPVHLKVAQSTANDGLGIGEVDGEWRG